MGRNDTLNIPRPVSVRVCHTPCQAPQRMPNGCHKHTHHCAPSAHVRRLARAPGECRPHLAERHLHCPQSSPSRARAPPKSPPHLAKRPSSCTRSLSQSPSLLAAVAQSCGYSPLDNAAYVSRVQTSLRHTPQLMV
jgi:hypothetical protein